MDDQLLPVVVDRTRRKRSKSHPELSDLMKPISEYTSSELVPSILDNTPQEKIFDYYEGGFMRVSLGQTLGSYKIVRKLGHGGFSTVWLGVDLRGKKQFSAIKIGKCSKRGFANIRKEVEIMKRLLSTDPSHRGYNFVMRFTHEMHINSTFGKHAVLVMETVGKSLFELFQEAAGRGINKEAAKSIAKQLLLGLTYMHEACNIIHTDLKPGNIIIKGSDKLLNDMFDRVQRYQELNKLVPRSYVSTLEYVKRKLEAGRASMSRYSPRTNPVEPRRRARSLDAAIEQREEMISERVLVSSHIEIKISDMGNAVCWQPVNNGLIQSPLYRSLEVYLTEKFDYSADIWSLGCILFELMTGNLLFTPKKPRLSTRDHVLLIFQMLKGVIPIHIRQNGVNVHRYFYPDGTFKRMWLVGNMESPRDVLIKYNRWSESEANVFGDLITACINPDPVARANASALLGHRWLTDQE